MASHACQALAQETETRRHAAVHPKQIDVTHKAMQPSMDGINWAKKVVVRAASCLLLASHFLRRTSEN
ncbi:hypothetical protein [Paucimonas lemoignei]|uniref:hypothetical protein n=1 Tax=Paucimonas lemoignei TaxID=29443 RepID=UPI00104F47E6|nr:hypothetical protein [Paucimonas lemoignei]